MSRAVVYVEGRSDVLALEALLRPLIDTKAQIGASIQFFEAPAGDRKRTLLEQVPRRAVSILRNDPAANVILGLADYADIAAACPQCFQPLLALLERIDP